MPMVDAMRGWTLEEMRRRLENGNKYELVFGELFVTPRQAPTHETIASRLTRILDPFVAECHLGVVYRPRAVLRHRGSEEPDLMVAPERFGDDKACSAR